MLRVRLIVGTALFIFICATFWLDVVYRTKSGLIVIVAVVSTVSLYEFYRMAEARGLKPFTWLGLVMGLAVVSSTHWWGWMDAGPQPGWRLGILLAALLFACFAAQLLRPTLQGTTTSVAVTLLGVLYIPFLCSLYIGIDHLKAGGTAAVLFVVFVAKSGDIGGYTAGRIFGGPKLAPVISPNKTIAGAVGGLTLSTIVGILTGRLLVGLSIPCALIGSILVGACAQLGDLCESMIKRDLEVKDAGNKLPGYGGVLDLLDCLLTAAPAGYLFFSF